MAKAVWHGRVIAESDDIQVVEGNAYFPRSSLDLACIRESSEKRTYCHWKGFSDYLDIVVDGEVNEGAAWHYEEPYEASSIIRDRVAFWRDVEITGAPEGGGLFESKPSLRDGRSGWEALCWLLSQTPKSTLTSADLEADAGIAANELTRMWEAYDVQRYARRYQWKLAGDAASPRLEKSS